MTTQTCPRCQARFEAQSGVDTCPACLLEAGLDPPGAATVPTSGTERFQSPALETLAEHFPHLEFRSLLGTGGMGAVYLARQKSLDRSVAIKILPAEIARDPAFAERFQREARTLARLNHPNIVTIFESGQVGPWCYLLMEYVDGITLRQAISDGGLAPKDSLEIVRQLCEALQYAHEMGVVHRDIKPENVLLDARGRIKIADFGLAKLVGGERGEFTLTRSHQVMGTWHYMAPEQFERPSDVDHRADLYSLGVVFYELLTGHLPVGRFEPPSERARVDASIDAVVLRALERQPQKRFQRASELREALDRVPPLAGRAPVKPAAQDAFAAAARDAVPPAKPTASGSSNSRRLPPLPFRIRKEGSDLAAGLARIRPEHLELEYRTHWAALWQDWSAFWHDFGRAKPGLHTLGIPWESICEIKLVQGWFGSRLQIRVDSVTLTSPLPGSSQGSFYLNIAKADFDLANAFVREVIGKLQLPEPLEEPAPYHREEVSSAQLATESVSFLPTIDFIGWVWAALTLLSLTLVLTFSDDGIQFAPPSLIPLITFQAGFLALTTWSHLTRASRVLTGLGLAIACIPSSTLFPFYLVMVITTLVAKRGLRDPGYLIHRQQQPRLFHRLFLLPPLTSQASTAVTDRRIRQAGIVAALVGLAGLAITMVSVVGHSRYGWNSPLDNLALEARLAFASAEDLTALRALGSERGSRFQLSDALFLTNALALVIAGVLLSHRIHWEACLIAAIVAVLPMSVGSLALLPFAIWLLVLLSQRPVRDAFAMTELQAVNSAAAPWNPPPLEKAPLVSSPADSPLRSGIDIPPRMKEFSPAGKPDALAPTHVNKFQTVAPSTDQESPVTPRRKLARWPLALVFFIDLFAIPVFALLLLVPTERVTSVIPAAEMRQIDRFSWELRREVDQVRRSLRHDLERAGIAPVPGTLDDRIEDSATSDSQSQEPLIDDHDSHELSEPLQIQIRGDQPSTVVIVPFAILTSLTLLPHTLIALTSFLGLIASLFWRGGWLHRTAAILAAFPIHLGCLVGIPWAVARRFSKPS